MHEMALCLSILEIVADHARRHDVGQVTVVRLELGSLSCAEPDALRFCFGAVARGSVAEGARLDIRVQPARAWCWECAAEVEIAARTDDCPRCRGIRLKPLDGDSMRVTELEAV